MTDWIKLPVKNRDIRIRMYATNEDIINNEITVEMEEQNKYFLYKELKELYLKGELEKPKDGMLIYHLNEERAKLGPKYLILDHWDNFLAAIQLGKDLEKLQNEMIWGKK